MTGLVALTLFATGVAAALLGDWVGRQAGKRRWSLFQLRPKHTGVLLTILCGAFLAAVSALPLTEALRQWQVVQLEVPASKDSLLHAQRRVQELQAQLVKEQPQPQQVAKPKPSAMVAAVLPSAKPVKPVPAIKPAVLTQANELLCQAAIRGGHNASTARLALHEVLALVERRGQRLGTGNVKVSEADLERAIAALANPGGYTVEVAATGPVTNRQELGVRLNVIAKSPSWGDLMEKDRLERRTTDGKAVLDGMREPVAQATAPAGDDLSQVVKKLPEEPKQVRLVVHEDKGPVKATVEIE